MVKKERNRTKCITEYCQKLKTVRENVRRNLHLYFIVFEFKGAEFALNH